MKLPSGVLCPLRGLYIVSFEILAQNEMCDNICDDLPVHIQEQYIGKVYHHSY